jgi:predicted ATP-grasp superfamily ATP-dependent carboligase
MSRVLVYEYLSGGGALESEAQAARLLPQGVAMRDSIVADLLRVPGIVTTCASCDRPGAAAPHGVLGTAAPRSGEPALAFVRRVAAEHDRVWAVAPESGSLLASLHEAVGASRWIGCDVAAIRIASSKRATVAALARHGVPTHLAFVAGHRGRWVVKPDDGAGALDTVVHRDLASAQADLHRRWHASGSATLEPFVEGKPLSISMLARAGSAEAIALNRQDIEVAADGTLSYRGVRHHAFDPASDPRAARVQALAQAVVRALPGLRGFVGIDLVWHLQRGPVVIEVNPRVTCAYAGLSATLKRNLAEEILALHAHAEACDAQH